MRLGLILVLLLSYAASSFAQVRVTKGAGQKTSFEYNVAAGAGDAATIFRRVLESDLIKSGWFIRGVPGQAEVVITGRADATGELNAECRAIGRAAQRNYLSKSYRSELNAARRLAHQAADDIILAVTGHAGLNSGRLALVGNRTGVKELYLCDADGGGLIQLTSDRCVSISPQWNPNGQQLVYTSFLKRYADIYTIELASGSRRRITNFPGLNTGGAVSPDGRDMALILSKEGNPDLYIRNIVSGKLTKLTNTPRISEASPSWSPDGSRIVYVAGAVSDPQLFIVSRSGGPAKRVTSRGSQNVSPDWGANGWIAHASLLGGQFAISILNPDTGEVRQISPAGRSYEDPSWAPDGRHIAAGGSERYQSKVYLLDSLNDPPIAITDYPGDWYSPAWAPRR